MKRCWMFFLCLFGYGCEQHSVNTVSNGKHFNKYTIKISLDKFDSVTQRHQLDYVIDTMTAYNDTVAYMTALTMFYEHEISDIENNRGNPVSFLIIDDSGKDLKNKLPADVIRQINNEAQKFTEVKKLVNDVYARDSIADSRTK